MHPILQQLGPDDLIVTPNRRLSQWLLREWQQHIDQPVWRAPGILPYNTWLSNLYQQQLNRGEQHCLLLNDFQEQQQWQRLLREAAVANELLQINSTAQLCKNAYQLCRQWQIPLEHATFAESEEGLCFQHLAQQFVQQCQQQSWLSHSDCLTAFLAKLSNLPTRIIFAGFIEFTTEQQQLITMLKSQGTTVTINPLQHHNNSKWRYQRFANVRDEFTHIAKHCQRFSEQYPDKTIACVVPNLQQSRELINGIFAEVTSGQYNISAAQPLSNYPIIAAALHILQCASAALDINVVSKLVKSPFIKGAQSERSARMNLDAQFYQHNIQNITIKKLIAMSEKSCPILCECFQQLQSTTGKKTFQHWANYFNTQCQAMGWPGERSLSSEEYQTVQRFQQALDELVALDLTIPPCSFSEALHLFTQLCQSIGFQAQTVSTNIQILGALEAGGLAFDELWLASIDENTWPAQTDSNPFIPKRLQQQYGLPRANHERTLQFYQQLTKQFQQASPVITCSYAAEVDGNEVQASPLFNCEITTMPSESNISYDAWVCENVEDKTIPLPSQHIDGGTYFFKAQSACPFQAFARFRLHAESLPDLYFALDGKDRGIIIHHILQLVWSKLQSQQQLHNLSDDEIMQLLSNSIEQALKPFHLSNTIQQLEQQRLQALIFDWLQTEKQREPFKIKQLENSKTFTVNGVSLSMRADRIDSTATGEMVIDYKTARVSLNDCLGERPKEPQLPLYTLADCEITAIALAQVRRDEFKLAQSDSDNWDDYQAQWQETIDNLSEEIKTGVATVTPRDTLCCNQCDLHSLCRIHQATIFEEQE